MIQAKEFVQKNFPHATDFTILQGGGSDRKYYRFNSEGKNLILAESLFVEENESFISLANHFKEIAPVPEIYKVGNDSIFYVQEDFGGEDLLSVLKKEGFSKAVTSLFKDSLEKLAKLQIEGDKNLDYPSVCFEFSDFNQKLILHDLYYFKNYFLDLLGINYSKKDLLDDFHKLSEQIAHLSNKKFMYRDFQSRNIMVQNSQVKFIDFQGGMKGPVVYDLISLIWQAKAQTPTDLKQELKSFYFEKIIELEPSFTKEQLEQDYELCLIVRLLQVLGAYGFRGLLQKKAHFVESIAFGIKNLKTLEKNQKLKDYPTLRELVIKVSTITDTQIEQLINEK